MAVRKITVIYKIGHVKLSQIHLLKGSPLIPIFSTLLHSLHCHSSVAQGHLHPIHPAWFWSLCTCPPMTSAINTLLAIWYSSILAQTIAILSDPFYSSFLTINLWYPNRIPQTHISRTFTFLLSARLIPHASALYNVVGTIVIGAII